ncbi:MAG: hypothetical protein J5654_06050 [Victivallales bacterium]|nr:hypothetical protein [Victivallales bacterium]
MTENPRLSFAERLRRRVDNTPVPAARSAAVLTQMLFGISALSIFCFSGWCLGWMSMNAAANAVVISGLVVAALYGMTLERYYRGLHMPKLDGAAKTISTASWVLLGILGMMFMRYCGFVVNTLTLLGLLYLFFAFLGYLISRGRTQELKLLGGSTLTGLAGWLLISSALICCVLRYTEGIYGPDFAETQMPKWFVAMLTFLDRQVGVVAMLIGGFLLVLVDWYLRLKVFALRSGEALRTFFNWQAKLAILFFLLLPIFQWWALRVLDNRLNQSVREYEFWGPCLSGISQEEFSEIRRQFIQWQEHFGRELGEATSTDYEPATRSPFQWRRETAGRWIPNVETAEETAALQEYYAKLQTVMRQLPEQVAKLRNGMVSSDGLLLILKWHVEANGQLHDSVAACECLSWATQLICSQLRASASTEVAKALGYLGDFCEMGELMLEKFGNEPLVLHEVEGQLLVVQEALQSLGQHLLRKTIEDFYIKHTQSSLTGTTRWGTPFLRIAWILPAPKMLVMAEIAELAKAVARSQSILDLQFPKRMYDSPAVRATMLPLIGPKNSLRSLAMLAQSRLQTMRLLIALMHYRLEHERKMPAVLAELVPEYLPTLPLDPLAEASPYVVSQEQMPIEAWNFHAQALETRTLPALVVRSSADSAICAKIMLSESEAVQGRVEAP